MGGTILLLTSTIPTRTNTSTTPRATILLSTRTLVLHSWLMMMTLMMLHIHVTKDVSIFVVAPMIEGLRITIVGVVVVEVVVVVVPVGIHTKCCFHCRG